MILYLSSTQHTNLLDFTGWYNAESEMPIKKMVGNFVLKQFIVYDGANFSHVTEVVLDRIAFGDSDEEFAQAIEEFLTMYNPRISVICEGLLQDSSLFRSLLESGMGNIVCSTDITEIQREILECLSEQGMVRYAAKGATKKAGGRKTYRFDWLQLSMSPCFPHSREWEQPQQQSVFVHGWRRWGLVSAMWRKMKAVFYPPWLPPTRWNRLAMAGGWMVSGTVLCQRQNR